jgi:signal transduction histidine kinase
VHDDLSQRAALLAIELERFAADSPPSGRQIAQRSTEFAHSAAELATDLHRLSHRLHPAKLEALGLVASIQGFCRELWTQHALQVHFDHHDVPARIPVDVSLCLYRIVQEGLLNVLKHSGTKKADVTLIGHDHELLLRIADPGQGFEQTQRGAVGLGLSSMRERVRSLSGDFVVHTAPGHGTRIGVKVRVDPVREKQSA